MEATLAGLSIGALIYGIIKSRQYSDQNNVSTVIPPSLQTALKTYQNDPSKDNLKRLEQLKQQEQMELDRVKKQAQDEANRKIAQIMEDAKAQAQRMYAQGKLEEAKNIEKLAQLKRTTVQEDTQANLQELAKRYQNTMTTINTMMTNAQLTSDKNLEKQIAAVTNELRTARNNEAILRNQVSQLQAKLQNQLKNASSINPQQMEEMRITVENAKRCSYEADMLKRELSMLKAASNGDQNAMRISSQFAELRRQLDEAKRNEQQLLFQLQNERMRRNSGANASSRYRIQQLESELKNLRMYSTGNSGKDIVITNLKNELEMAQKRESDTLQQLAQMRSAMDNARRFQSDGSAAQQRIYELERQLENLNNNASNRVSQMANEISQLKSALQFTKDQYNMLKQDKNASTNNSVLLSNAKNEIRDLQRKLNNINIAGNAKTDDMRSALKIVELEMELQRAKLDKRPSYDIERQIQVMKSKSSPETQQLVSIVSELTNKLEQARANEKEAKKALSNARASDIDTGLLNTELTRARNEAQQLQNDLNSMKKAAPMSRECIAQAQEIASLQQQLQTLKQSQPDVSQALQNAKIAQDEVQRLRQQVYELQSYKERVDELENELKNARLQTPSAQSDTIQGRANQVISQVVQQANTLRDNAQNEARQLVYQANSTIMNASSNTRVKDLQLQLEKAKGDAQQIESTANAKYEALLQTTKQLEQEVIELRKHHSALENATNKIDDFNNANSARRQLNEVISNFTHTLPSNAQNANLDDCLKKVANALRDAKMDMSKVEQFILDVRSDDPNLQQEIKQLRQVLEIKNKALLEAEKVQTQTKILDKVLVDKTKEFKDRDPTKAIIDVVHDAQAKTNQIIEIAKTEVEQVVNNNMVCPLKTCAQVTTEVTCGETMPPVILDFDMQVYKFFYERLHDCFDKLYNLKTALRNSVYLTPIYKGYGSDVDEYGMSLINQDTLLQKHNNVFIPLINMNYTVEQGKPNIKNLLLESRQGIYNTLLELKGFIAGKNIDTTFMNIFNPPVDSDQTKYEPKDIIQFYIALIKTILNSPVTFKFTSLYTIKVRELLNPDKFTELQLFDERSGGPIYRPFFLKMMYKFLYVDITSLLQLRNNLQISTFYGSHLKHYEDKIILQDTMNCALILMKGGKCSQRYLYIERFINSIENASKTTSLSSASFNQFMMLYIAYNLPFIITFVGYIYSNVEDNNNNESLTKYLDEVILEKLNSNILTYIKVRKDDDLSEYNFRYRVFVNNDSTMTKNTTLLVKYNEHNIPYYMKNNINRIVPVNDLEKTYSNIYKYPSFETVFGIQNDELYVKKYQEEYLLGPFTRVFHHAMSNKQVATDMSEVKTHLSSQNPRPVFLIGYGSSGAGKTSTLIYFNKPQDRQQRNGVLMHLCKELSDNFPNILVKCYEVFSKVNKDSIGQENIQHLTEKRESKPLHFQYKPEIGEFVLVKDYVHNNKFPTRVSFAYPQQTEPKITNFAAGSSLGEVLIHMIDIDRFVKATTNNPNSSRSHTIIFVKFGNSQGYYNEKRTLIIGDFAGVENAFDCEDNNQLLGFLRVKEDRPNGNLFYSNEDPSLYGAEGGMHRKRLRKQRKTVGGAYDKGCEFVRNDQTEYFFELGKSDIKIRPNNSSLNIKFKNILGNDYNIFKEEKNANGILEVKPTDEMQRTMENVYQLFAARDTYANFLQSIFKDVLDVNQKSTNADPLEVLLSSNEIHKDFANYMRSAEGFDKLVNNVGSFFKILDTMSKKDVQMKDIRDYIFKQLYVDKQNVYDFITNGSLGFVIDDIRSNTTLLKSIQSILKMNNYNKVADSIIKELKEGGWELKVNTLQNGQQEHILYHINGKNATPLSELTKASKKQFPYYYFGVVPLGSFGLDSSCDVITKFNDYIISNGTGKTTLTRMKIIPSTSYARTAPTVIKMEMRTDDIFKEMKKLFESPLFKYIGLNVAEMNSFTIDKLVKSFVKHNADDEIEPSKKNMITEHNKRLNLLQKLLEKYKVDNQENTDTKFDVKQLCIAIVKEAYDAIMDMMCRKQYYKHICQVRRQEGVFINNSLSDIRELIKDIMFEKNKDSINISPLFHKPCLPAYCERSDCFSLSEQKKTVKSLVFDVIVKELATDRYTNVQRNLVSPASVLQDLVIGVFVVINLSSMANNPPPVPYIDTNSVRVAIGETGYITTNVIAECRRLTRRLYELMHGVVKLEIPQNIMNNITTIYLNNDILQDTYNTKTTVDNLIQSLEFLEKISAASLIGTLHYADAFSKYNTTNAICTQYVLKKKDINVYNSLLTQLKLKDIASEEEHTTQNVYLQDVPNNITKQEQHLQMPPWVPPLEKQNDTSYASPQLYSSQQRRR